MFHLCQAAERALISQVVAAVESPYLAAAERKQKLLWGHNLKLLQHLSTTCGHITPQQLKAKEMDICNMQFNMSHPVDIVFNAIDDLIKISENALMPISSSQAVNLAYVEFVRNPILLQDLWDGMGCHEDTPSRSSMLPKGDL